MVADEAGGSSQCGPGLQEAAERRILPCDNQSAQIAGERISRGAVCGFAQGRRSDDYYALSASMNWLEGQELTALTEMKLQGDNGI